MAPGRGGTTRSRHHRRPRRSNSCLLPNPEVARSRARRRAAVVRAPGRGGNEYTTTIGSAVCPESHQRFISDWGQRARHRAPCRAPRWVRALRDPRIRRRQREDPDAVGNSAIGPERRGWGLRRYLRYGLAGGPGPGVLTGAGERSGGFERSGAGKRSGGFDGSDQRLRPAHRAGGDHLPGLRPGTRPGRGRRNVACLRL